MAKTHGTNVHTIDGKTYVEVERKAEVGEKVIVTAEAGTMLGEDHFGKILTVVEYEDNLANTDGFWNDGSTLNLDEEDYRVLEPVTEWPPLTEESIELTANDIRWQPDKLIELLANLARRVSSLEQQLADTQNNLVRQGEELEEVRYGNNEIYMRLKGVEERTTNHRDELNVIDHEKAMIFEDIISLSKRIRKLNGGAAE